MTAVLQFANLPRLARRYAGFARQALRDLHWHRRYSGPEFSPRATRILEQSRLLVRSAITAEDYYNHGLFRQSLSFEDKAAFLGYFEKSRYFNTINPPVYDVLARDKALFQIVAAALKIPTPETLATTAPANRPSFGVPIHDAMALRDFLARDDSEDLFFKPVDGSLGEGALSLGSRIEGGQSWRTLPTGAPIDLDGLVQHLRADDSLRRFLIQRRLRPHPEFAEIVPDVCPTIRIMTLTGLIPVFLGSALRLGSGSSPTDNLSGGGVVAAVDHDSGRLGLAVNIDRGIPVRSERHPVTGMQISGRTVPGWRDVVELVETSAAKLSYLPCLAWDIGITDRGPVVIEINTRARCRPLQIGHDMGILRGPLGAALQRYDGTGNSGLIIAKHRRRDAAGR